MRNHFIALRQKKGLKIVSGMRGAGKSVHLLEFRDILISEGVPASRILYLDAESQEIRRFTTCEQIINHVEKTLPRDGASFVLIREAGSLADAEITLGSLSASSRYEIYLTISSRQLFAGDLGKYLAGTQSILELPPPDLGSMTVEQAQARWNTIFINDVLKPQRILDVRLVCCVAGFLSDNLGDPISLRQIGAAVSPSGRLISPHTVETYLEALANAFLVEKVLRFDIAENSVQPTRYCYFFTSLALRNAQFGTAPDRETERVKLNQAWLLLRRRFWRVYIASGSSSVDFVSISRDGSKSFWHIGESGPESIPQNDVFCE